MIRLALRVRRADAEIVLAELLSLAPEGVEEADLGAGVVEYAVYGAPGELPALPKVRAAAGDAFVDVVTTEVADDWAERWRAFHAPVTVGGRLHVRAPWHAAGPPGAHDVVIDPGQAFGTGAHATTRLCLELLLEVGDERAGAVDLGCGSGVLAIAAAKLGHRPVLGVDHDPLALDATANNAAANGVRIAVRAYDLMRDGPAPVAPLVLANLLGPLLRHLAEVGFDPPGEPPRALIASGLLAAEAGDVAAAFARRGLHECTRRTDGDWAALLLVQ